jgi:hypothetical protein
MISRPCIVWLAMLALGCVTMTAWRGYYTLIGTGSWLNAVGAALFAIAAVYWIAKLCAELNAGHSRR